MGSSEDEGSGEDSTPADVEDFVALATGTHTANVYLDGERARLQVLDKLAERNLYLDGEAGEAWYVDSETQTATGFALPSDADLEQYAELEQDGLSEKPDQLQTPDEMLDDALARLDESTEVTIGTDARVAGRDVYELILTPRTKDTLIGELRFAIDGENGVALAASVTARGSSEPAFEVAFSRVSFDAPDAALLAFSPGEDTAVVEKELPLPTPDELMQAHSDAAETDAAQTDAAAPTVVGDGWSAVVVSPLPAESEGRSGLDPEELGMLNAVTSAVDGGRVLQTSLVTVLFADDGRVLAGAVPAARLVEVAQTGR